MQQPVIICVDDDETILTTLKEQLKSHLRGDYTIEVAESGEEALELLEELIEEEIEIPVFITDHIMPGIKGDYLLKLVHNRLPQTLKILLTGQASADAVGNAVNEARLYRYIGKPWEEVDLTLTVKEAIKSYFQNKDIKRKQVELEKLNRELARKVETFYKFVPGRFLELLHRKADFERIELGACTEYTMSVMFSDIRSFTRLSEHISPEDTIRFLNSYLSNMGPIIRNHHGFIDKYIGDSIMGLFENADSAVGAGIDMIMHLYTYNQWRQKSGYVPIRIGIGINSGNVMLGTIGEDHRIETTVIGDVVNLSSRIETLTKLYGQPLLISEFTLRELTDPSAYHVRFVDKVKVKGRATIVDIFEVFDADPEHIREKKLIYMEKYKEAINLFGNRKRQEAARLFKEIWKINPEDKLVQYYLNRLKKHGGKNEDRADKKTD